MKPMTYLACKIISSCDLMQLITAQQPQFWNLLKAVGSQTILNKMCLALLVYGAHGNAFCLVRFF